MGSCTSCNGDVFSGVFHRCPSAPSGQLEAGEVTVTEEHRIAACWLIRSNDFVVECSKYMEGTHGSGWLEGIIARAFAKCDAAAERRGAERERNEGSAFLEETAEQCRRILSATTNPARREKLLHDESIWRAAAAAIRARSKP